MVQLIIKKPAEAGFTLLEILVVMVIIGILAAIGLGNFQSSQIKARDVQRKSDLGQISKTLEVYYNDKGEYPLGNGGVIMGCGAAAACTWGEIWQDDKDTIYMVALPADPRSNNYYYLSDGTYFKIYALLENTWDKDIGSYAGTTCGELVCNYGVSSTNVVP